MRGYRCLKCIYYTIHKPELEPKVTEAQQQIFDIGNAVGEKAREYYLGGTLVDCKPWEFVDSLRRTRELLQSGVEHIYEAAFEYKGCYARADILRYNKSTQRWTLLEVKSTTKIKPEHLDDIGLQAWIIANSGLKLEKICLVHLNPECRYPDLKNLFIEVDVTDRLRENYSSISPRLNSIFTAIRKPEVPEIALGPQCTLHRRDCEFKTACWQEHGIPDFSVFDLPKISDKAWELYQSAQVEIDQIDSDKLDDLQKRVVKAHLSQKRFVDKDGVYNAVKDWAFPLIFLDFETINPAIPRYDGTSPYQQIPFQFSVHIWREPHAELEHLEFLHDTDSDPRPSLIPALIAACEGNGSVVAYYSKFERQCLEDLADFATSENDRLKAIAARLVDPLPVIRDHVYDPAFQGSFSLKYVAPALLGDEFSYEGMAVSDGSAAQRAFARLIQETDPSTREQIRSDMLNYCTKDTLAMVETVRWLLGVSNLINLE